MKKVIYLLIATAILSIAFFTSCSEDSNSPDSQSIEGVLEYDDGNQVHNAVIEAGDMDFNEILSQDTTDNEGNFILTGLPMDLSDLYVRVKLENKIKAVLKINDLQKDSEGDSDKKVKIKLLSEDTCCAELKITVKDGEDYIKEAEVRLNKGDDIIEKKYSDENGEVKFEDICEGEYWIRIAKDGYNVVEKEIALDSCESKEYDIELTKKDDEEDCCGKLQIRAIDKESGEAIANAQVKITLGGEIIETLKTDEDGYVKFDGLCLDKQYNLRIYKEGYNVIEESIKLTDCEEWKELTFKLQSKDDDCCDNKIKVSARDLDSEELLKGAKITLWQNGQKIKVKELQDDWIIFEEVCKGVYWIDIVKDGYEEIEWEIEVTCSNEKEFSKKLKKK